MDDWFPAPWELLFSYVVGMSQGEQVTTSLSFRVSRPPLGQKEELAGRGRFWSVSRNQTFSAPAFSGNCVERTVGLDLRKQKRDKLPHLAWQPTSLLSTRLPSAAANTSHWLSSQVGVRWTLSSDLPSSVPSTQPLPASRPPIPQTGSPRSHWVPGFLFLQTCTVLHGSHQPQVAVYIKINENKI